MKVSDIYGFIDSFAPFSSQAQWDNSGVLVGNKDSDVTRVLLCLDVTDESIIKAVKEKCELIVSHHPAIFRPCKSFLSDSISYKAAVNGIAVIAAHTNLDKAEGGVNDCLCEMLGMAYEKCPEDVADGFLNTGVFPVSYTAQELALHIKNCLGGCVSYSDAGKTITKAAVCSGSGADFIGEAALLGCDAFITGEASYHSLLDAKASGISVFAAGHYETEAGIIPVLAEKLKERFKDTEFIVFTPSGPVSSVK